MCLSKAIAIDTTEDIICYKVYISYKDRGIVSPYMKSPIPELNTTVYTSLKVILGDCVTEGFHSFVTVQEATQEVVDWEGFDPIIMKCIIPKGSKCYEGEFMGLLSYCSECIKLIEKIDYVFNY